MAIVIALTVFTVLRGRADITNAIVIYPSRITLNGIGSTQRVLCGSIKDQICIADMTPRTKFSTSNPKVAIIDANGTVRSVGVGQANITANSNGQTASSRVIVSGPNIKNINKVSFRNDVLPILTKSACNSGACHGAAAGKGGLRLTLRGFDPAADYNSLVRQALGRRVRPGNPGHSLLILKPTMAVGHGGGERIKVGSPEYRAISAWIADGANMPSETDVKLVSVETLPNRIRIKPGQEQQLIAIGHYSDGTSKDVTRWVKYGVADGLVATVDDSGRIKGLGSGETAITSWYSSKVTYSQVSLPFGTPLVSRSTGNNIDGFVDAKLASLGLPSSEKCNDATFLRRASIDLTGELPSKHVLDQLAASEPLDRAAYVEKLLGSSEFVDFWTYKWSDMLLVSSKKMAGPALTSFYNWIREGVEKDKPWDQFAREVITASGSNLDNGAANFYLLHKDPIDALETTTQAFMGLSLTCARCHNHPMEKWTQRDYYQMANLYSRVRLKNGDRAGETLTLVSTEGNINHPRLGVPLPPRPLDGVPLSMDAPGDRRIPLASWLTSPENGYFSRAVVNRVWKAMMGRGLMEPEDDLRQTNPPSNPDLMDHLSAVFVTGNYPGMPGRGKYSVRALIRYIASSEAYQRKSEPVGINAKDDKYYSHYIVRRFPSEAILDAVTRVTGVPSDFAGYPKGTHAYQLRDSLISNYFLTAFGRPERTLTCSCERQADPSVAQALHLVNGDTIHDKLRDPNGVPAMLAKRNATDDEVLDILFDSALSRRPTSDEIKRLKPLLQTEPGIEPSKFADMRKLIIEDLFWAILTDIEFLFNH